MSANSFTPHFAVLGAYNVRPAGSVRSAVAIPGTIGDLRLTPQFGACGNMALSHGLGNEKMNDGYFNLCNAFIKKSR